MCTVTYLPLSGSSFVLTHNRDEHHTRSVALLPEKKIIDGIEITFPKDEQGGGTWFASSKDYTLCLLNGGFEKHVPAPPYKHSRGLVILDFFKYNNISHFKNEYNFEGIEPFTLIIVEHASQQLHEFVNDAGNLYHKIRSHDNHHIWSSSTLYTVEEREKRTLWFSEWIRIHKVFSQQEIIEFHKNKHDEYKQEGIMINRASILFTVSLTSVFKNEQNEINLIYEDFIQQKSKYLVI